MICAHTYGMRTLPEHLIKFAPALLERVHQAIRTIACDQFLATFGESTDSNVAAFCKQLFTHGYVPKQMRDNIQHFFIQEQDVSPEYLSHIGQLPNQFILEVWPLSVLIKKYGQIHGMFDREISTIIIGFYDSIIDPNYRFREYDNPIAASHNPWKRKSVSISEELEEWITEAMETAGHELTHYFQSIGLDRTPSRSQRLFNTPKVSKERNLFMAKHPRYISKELNYFIQPKEFKANLNSVVLTIEDFVKNDLKRPLTHKEFQEMFDTTNMHESVRIDGHFFWHHNKFIEVIKFYAHPLYKQAMKELYQELTERGILNS